MQANDVELNQVERIHYKDGLISRKQIDSARENRGIGRVRRSIVGYGSDDVFIFAQR